LLADLQTFIKERVGDTIVLNIPTFSYGQAESVETLAGDPSLLVIEDLARYFRNIYTQSL